MTRNRLISAILVVLVAVVAAGVAYKVTRPSLSQRVSSCIQHEGAEILDTKTADGATTINTQVGATYVDFVVASDANARVAQSFGVLGQLKQGNEAGSSGDVYWFFPAGATDSSLSAVQKCAAA